MLGRYSDLNFVACKADLKGVDLDLGVVAPFSVMDAKAPGVPGTGDDALFEIAASKRGPHVRTEVVDGGEFSPFIEDGHHAAIDRVGLSLANGDVADFGDSDEIGHIRFGSIALRFELTVIDSRDFEF